MLGDFHLFDNEQPVSKIHAGRQQALLAYLILHRDAPQPRQYLAFQFWPDLPEEQSRNNLRQLLHQIRQDLPTNERFLEISASMVQWHLDTTAHVDIIDFEEALDRASQAERSGNTHIVVTDLEKAIKLYQGDLLPACYDDWIIPERDRLRQRYREALDRIIALLERQRAYQAAAAYARQLVLLDRLDENSYRLLMRLNALNGDRNAALRAYQDCVNVLEQELGVKPEPATEELYQRLFSLQGESPAAMTASQEETPPPLVGRDDAWLRLLDVAHRYDAPRPGSISKGKASGSPHCVILTGEAGIGKTRLAEELLDWAARQGISTARARAYAAEGNLSYSPLIAWLESKPVRSALLSLDKIWLGEISRLLPDLRIEYPDIPNPEPMKEHWERQRFFQALARAILSAPRPLFLLLDDLQWCDADTLEWLHYLLRFDPQAPILVVGTVRVDEMLSNPGLGKLLMDLRNLGLVTEITLLPLDAAETARLAEQVLGREIQVETALRLFDDTEGNPLFILETLQSRYEPADAQEDQETRFRQYPKKGINKQGAISAESPGSQSLGLPPKVYAVIAARLSQLSEPARELAGLAAAAGRAVPLDVLFTASHFDEEQFTSCIETLWQRRILRALDENLYDFTHDKLREVAYAETSPARRQMFHRRFAQALEAAVAGSPDSYHAQIAAHYDQAGMPSLAIPYYQQAAQVSQRVGATEEAIHLLKRALALLQVSPKGLTHIAAKATEKASLELDLLLALGVAQVDAFGHAAPEVMETYQRAKVICQELNRPVFPPVLRGLALIHIGQADYQNSLQVGRQLLEQGEKQSDLIQVVEGHYVIGVALTWMGDFIQGRKHLELALASYNLDQAHTHLTLYSQDPQAICLVRLAFLLWQLGYPDQAQQASAQALEIARERAHPFSLAYVIYWDIMLQNHLGAIDQAEARAQAFVSYCKEHQNTYWLPQGKILLGWIRAERGNPTAGMEQIRQGMEDVRGMGANFQQTFYLALLARFSGKAGQSARGLEFVSQALKAAQQYDEHWFEAEIYRFQAELFTQLGQDQAAEKAYQTSMAVACRQGAKMLEIRAATGLARLLMEQGRRDQAREIVAPLCEWFQEGLDLPDLISARRLLEE